MPSSPELEPRAVAATLRGGLALERAGQLNEATAVYEEAIGIAEESGDRRLLAEALCRLGVIHHRWSHRSRAAELCQRSYDEAVGLGDMVLAGDALVALGEFDLEAGAIRAARWNFQNALALSGGSAMLRGRIERNLGIVSGIHGDHDAARHHLRASLIALEVMGDTHGAALTTHYLGLLAMRMGELDAGAQFLIQAAETAGRIGDHYLQGLCDRSTAELFQVCRQFGSAQARAESALRTFERMQCPIEQSAACRVLGMIHRDTGRPVPAAERLQTALALAIETGWVLGQAEALRELAILERATGQRERALTLLRSAQELFARLEAQADLADVAERIGALS